MKQVRVVILTNTRQADRFRSYTQGGAPDPNRERQILAENGVQSVLYDRGNFPWNPFAKSHILYAGLDPLRALRIMLFERNSDLVLCIFENTAFFLCLLRHLFRFKPKIVLMEVNGRGWRPRDLILDVVMPRVDHVIVLTRQQADYVRTAYRTNREPAVLDWVVDELFYTPQRGYDQGYILAVGEDSSRDFETLIAACAKIDRPLVLKTGRDVVVPASMLDRVRIVRDRLPHRAFRDLYAGAAVVAVPLVPTDHPGGISTLLEAMAMGRPIVASDSGTTRDILEDGCTGLIVPSREPEAFRAALHRVLDDTNLAESLASKARARIETTYAMPVRHAKLAALLKSFMGAGRTKDNRE